MKSAEQEYKEGLQWFIDRIGKRVFRNATSCKCAICKEAHKVGFIISDEFHAHYLHDTVGSYAADGDVLKYFDTKKEQIEFETKLKKS